MVLFEVLPLGGGHRRLACSDPDVIAANVQTPELIQNWSFEIISETLFDDPDANLLIHAYTYFDNYQNSEDIRVKTNDIERLVTLWNLISVDARYSSWKTTPSAIMTLVQTEMVC